MIKHNLILSMLVVFLINIDTALASHEEGKDNFFSASNSKLYYEIGGANRISRPPINNTVNLRLGFGARANLGYSCGKFDIGASFSNLMNSFKNGSNRAINAVTDTANAAISSLPALILQRAQPGLYDMFQEYKFDATTDINIAAKSCEEMEELIANGENPYASFLQTSKAEVWKNEAASGQDITIAKENANKNAGTQGVSSFGRKVGGKGQPPMLVVTDTVKAGYNTLNNSRRLTSNITAPKSSELAHQFASANEASLWATDVLGEFEIDNNKPITKIGTGLLPKVAIEKKKVLEQFNNQEYDKLDLSQEVIEKIALLPYKNQQTVLNNIVDDIAIKNTIAKSLIIRRLLLSGSQASVEQHLDKKVAKLESEIRSLIFERDIRQNLANQTILEVLKIKKTKGDKVILEKPDDKLFLKLN